MGKKPKYTDEERKQRWAEFLEKLRNMPPEKLSPIAKSWLSHKDDENEWIICDMKAVLR